MLIRRGRLRRERSGTSAVEFAIVSPVIVALIMGQLESSRLGMVVQLLTTAAREGCRTAVIEGATLTDVQTRITTVLNGSGISVGAITPTCPSPYSWDSAPKGMPITVSMSVPYSQVSWLGTPFFLNGATVSASATLSSERP